MSAYEVETSKYDNVQEAIADSFVEGGGARYISSGCLLETPSVREGRNEGTFIFAYK